MTSILSERAALYHKTFQSNNDDDGRTRRRVANAAHRVARVAAPTTPARKKFKVRIFE